MHRRGPNDHGSTTCILFGSPFAGAELTPLIVAVLLSEEPVLSRTCNFRSAKNSSYLRARPQGTRHHRNDQSGKAQPVETGAAKLPLATRISSSHYPSQLLLTFPILLQVLLREP